MVVLCKGKGESVLASHEVTDSFDFGLGLGEQGRGARDPFNGWWGRECGGAMHSYHTTVNK